MGWGLVEVGIGGVCRDAFWWIEGWWRLVFSCAETLLALGRRREEDAVMK